MTDEKTRKRIEQEAKKILMASGEWGNYPTKFNAIAEHIDVIFNETPIQHPSFLGALFNVVRKKAAEKLDQLAVHFPMLENAFRNIRGVLLFDERTIFVDQNSHPHRVTFYKWHEIGHAVIPWHQDILKRCREEDMSPWAREDIEREANYCAAQFMFQGDNFQKLVDDTNSDNGFDTIDSVHHICRTSLESCARQFAFKYESKEFYFVLVRRTLKSGRLLPFTASESMPKANFSIDRLRIIALEVLNQLHQPDEPDRILFEGRSLLIDGKEIPVLIDAMITAYTAFALFKIPRVALAS